MTNFLGVEYYLKWKFNFENNLRIKQQFSPQMSNYTQQKFRTGADYGEDPRPFLRTLEFPLVGGTAPMLPGGEMTLTWSASQPQCLLNQSTAFFILWPRTLTYDLDF